MSFQFQVPFLLHRASIYPKKKNESINKNLTKFKCHLSRSAIPQAVDLSMSRRGDKSVSNIRNMTQTNQVDKVIDIDNGDYDEDEKDEELSSSLNLQPSVFTNMVSSNAGNHHLRNITENPTNSSGIYSPASDGSHSLKARPNNTNTTSSRAATNTDDEDDDMYDLNSSMISSCSGSSSNRSGIGSRLRQLNGSSGSNRSLKSPSCLVIDDSGLDDKDSSLNASSSSLNLNSSLSTSRKSGRKRTATQIKDFVSSDLPECEQSPTPVKQRRKHGRSHSDVPEGYMRVKCGEDCEYDRCAYRRTVTHFHCLRFDCGYGFSDKSRISQHTTRHTRLDLLMSDDFQQFRSCVTCQYKDCEFDLKASHFHCLKCQYACADSSKVKFHFNCLFSFSSYVLLLFFSMLLYII